MQAVKRQMIGRLNNWNNVAHLYTHHNQAHNMVSFCHCVKIALPESSTNTSSHQHRSLPDQHNSYILPQHSRYMNYSRSHNKDSSSQAYNTRRCSHCTPHNFHRLWGTQRNRSLKDRPSSKGIEGSRHTRSRLMRSQFLQLDDNLQARLRRRNPQTGFLIFSRCSQNFLVSPSSQNCWLSPPSMRCQQPPAIQLRSSIAPLALTVRLVSSIACMMQHVSIPKTSH